MAGTSSKLESRCLRGWTRADRVVPLPGVQPDLSCVRAPASQDGPAVYPSRSDGRCVATSSLFSEPRFGVDSTPAVLLSGALALSRGQTPSAEDANALELGSTRAYWVDYRTIQVLTGVPQRCA